MDESSQTGAPSCAAQPTSGPSPVDTSLAGEATGRPSAEALCRQVLAILDAGRPDTETVKRLLDLFDMPDPDPSPVVKRPWPPLQAADDIHDPRD